MKSLGGLLVVCGLLVYIAAKIEAETGTVALEGALLAVAGAILYSVAHLASELVGSKDELSRVARYGMNQITASVKALGPPPEEDEAAPATAKQGAAQPKPAAKAPAAAEKKPAVAEKKPAAAEKKPAAEEAPAAKAELAADPAPSAEQSPS